MAKPVIWRITKQADVWTLERLLGGVWYLHAVFYQSKLAHAVFEAVKKDKRF